MFHCEPYLHGTGITGGPHGIYRPPTPVFCAEHFHRVSEVCVLFEFTAIIPPNMMSRPRVTSFAPFMHVLQH